jgi:hypothetical protein
MTAPAAGLLKFGISNRVGGALNPGGWNFES